MEQTIEKSIEEKIENLITQSLEKRLGEIIGQNNELVAKEWLNVQETCDYIGISYKNLQKLIDQGLKCISIGRSKRFSRTEINHFLKNTQA
ncbi:helix-turn-helix domain-containing protein [Solibacillus sp. FSL R7-0668]|uniref:helix-turn-helix domain-containing protein n=1 Tax=Solibacillus sp. FSL R7-0668 TaxID=2921688 RepID=UPI0030FD05AC